jgi:hypothetical protein
MPNTDSPQARAEHRWPAVLALLIALGLYATLPSAFLPGLRYTVVAVGLAMLIPLLILNPRRLHKETRWSKNLATGHADRKDMPVADFRFPQDEDHDAIDEVAARSSKRTGWVASFVDYLYFSLSNSMAFSPTDTMPLSGRAKVMMGLEAAGGFVLLALVIARAVSLLS